jgi:hypothetical protein
MAAVANIEVVQREAAIQEDVGDLPKADIETALMVAASECVWVFVYVCQQRVGANHQLLNVKYHPQAVCVRCSVPGCKHLHPLCLCVCGQTLLAVFHLFIEGAIIMVQQ